MGKFRNWLMHMIAGRKYAYWTADDAWRDLAELRSIPGEAGAIMLVRSMEQIGATSATLTFAGYEIAITARPGSSPAADGGA